MKEYETAAASLQILDFHLPVLCRIDGHKFSTFTRGFTKPFDTRIHDAMVATTVDLVDQFGCATGYTFSDEITLVFTPLDDHQEVPYNGKVGGWVGADRTRAVSQSPAWSLLFTHGRIFLAVAHPQDKRACVAARP
jgi:tRNA(His) 5'-end guanylyltransferase